MARFHSGKQHKVSKRWWLWLLSFPALLIVAALVIAGWYSQNLKPLSDSNEEIIVTIPVGTSTKGIGEILEQREVIKSAKAFDWYTRLNDHRNDLQAGGYKFSPSLSVEQIVQKLLAGDIAKDLVTILPAQTLDQIKVSLSEYGYTYEEINNALNPSNYSEHPALKEKPQEASLEGYLYPDSYQRSSEVALEQIITASLDEMAEVLTPDLIQSIKMQGLTVHQALTLASIIENEVPFASDDRETVAQVYLKRLDEGMLLQADPTARYGAILATGSDSGWRNFDSPYNTYLYSGLPPGPISNVSESSIRAVVNPTKTDYLFFVADDNDENTTHFSRTLSEHEAAIAKYCQVKCRSY